MKRPSRRRITTPSKSRRGGSSSRGGSRMTATSWLLLALGLGGAVFVGLQVSHLVFLHGERGRSSGSPLPQQPAALSMAAGASFAATRGAAAAPESFAPRPPTPRASLPPLPPLPVWSSSVALHRDAPALVLWKRAEDVGALYARFRNLTFAGERSKRFSRVAQQHFALERIALGAAMRHVRLRLENLLTKRLFDAAAGPAMMSSLETEYEEIAANLLVVRDVLHAELAKAREALNDRSAVQLSAERDVTAIILGIADGPRVVRRVRALRRHFPLMRVMLAGDNVWLPPLAPQLTQYVEYFGNVPLAALLERVVTQYVLVFESDAVGLEAPERALPALLSRALKSSLDIVGASYAAAAGSAAATTTGAAGASLVVCEALDRRREWILARAAMQPARHRCEVTSASFLASIAGLRRAGGWDSSFADHATELLDLALRGKNAATPLKIGIEVNVRFTADDLEAVRAMLRVSYGRSTNARQPRLGGSNASSLAEAEAGAGRAMVALGAAHGVRSVVAPDGTTLNVGCTATTSRCPIDFAARNRTMPPCCKEKLRTTLHFISSLLTKEKIAHWIDFSTLLGAVRHNGDIVPWDVDADLSLMKDDFVKLDALAPQFAAAGHLLHPESEGLSRVFYSKDNANHVVLRAWAFQVCV